MERARGPARTAAGAEVAGGVWGELQSDSLGISLLEAFMTHALQSLSTDTRRRIMFKQKDFQSFSKSFGVFLNNFIS